LPQRYRQEQFGSDHAMKLFGKDLSREVVVIAEVGVNHEGDVEAASRLLRLAAGTGADAVKFQTYSPDRFISASLPDRVDAVSGRWLDEAAHRRLAREAADLGIAFFSSAITEDVVPLLDELSTAIKIASGDLTFEPVIRAAARTGKPVILSTGLGTTEDIDQAVEWFVDEVGEDECAEKLALLHCVAAYPTPGDQTNVLSVPFLRERYGLVTGYSHHALGLEPCFAAVALGARIIEAHFTDQKHDRDFHDHALSLEPSEMAQLVTSSKAILASLGRYGKQRMPAELPGLQAMRKGIAAARDLEAGTILGPDDIKFARPATEFASTELDQVVGHRLTGKLASGELIPRNGLE
jgi:N,N'-diacetyllegionaminate synthase